MKQKECQRLIFKIHTKQLKREKWNLQLPLAKALKEYPDCVVTLASSQCLRFIDEINGQTNIDAKIRNVKNQIKAEKKKEKSVKTKNKMKELYSKLYALQFQPDYVCVVMDSNKDYDRANKGFSINGIEYKRFLGTNGGIKNSTIVYVNKNLYPELKKRLDCGRNPDALLVPAKLEAYQALICSGSTPIPQPQNVIVVNDCITHFKDNVIVIDDSGDGEPTLTHVNDYEIEHNDSDGYGLMSPSYSRKINKFLNDSDNTLSGFTIRYAWTKGMVYTFDFVEFAEKIANNFIVKDAWGQDRDIRQADLILTTSMLKLWDSYDSWDDFYSKSQENHYKFCATKSTPLSLESVHNTNYQFLQSYDLSDDELKELCQPTIDEIKDALGLDYRKSLVFLAGHSLTDKSVEYLDNYIKALMIEPALMNDIYIRRKIYYMIQKRIDQAKKGVISIDANYAMISGDPFALCQSMFGQEVTGLLKSGELYHKYWIDKGSKELTCFRAPMTCHNNIRKLRLNDSPECKHWYQFITTAIVLNAWDTTCDAMNGQDKDGDTNMDTDNPILLRHTLNSPTIICMQRKAEKVIPDESSIIASNKLAFNDDIGTVTNHVTSMFEVQAGFDKDSEEYKTLEYRIMCGQHYQQTCIDRCKGIISKPMPNYWYSRKAVKDNDDINNRIVAYRKPYFMIYVYQKLKKDFTTFFKNAKAKAIILGHNEEFDKWYNMLLPVGTNNCLVNRICKHIEDAFKDVRMDVNDDKGFDYTILKSDATYSKREYNAIMSVYADYLNKVGAFHKRQRTEIIDKEAAALAKEQFIQTFITECQQIVPNEDALCNIVLDICYKSTKSKSFAWDICGDVIVKNLLARNNGIMRYPVLTNTDGEFAFRGMQFIMGELKHDYNERKEIC